MDQQRSRPRPRKPRCYKCRSRQHSTGACPIPVPTSIQPRFEPTTSQIKCPLLEGLETSLYRILINMRLRKLVFGPTAEPMWHELQDRTSYRKS